MKCHHFIKPTHKLKGKGIEDLAIKGVIASELGISPRNKVEINNGDEIVFKELDQVIDNEVSAVGAKGLIVQSQGDFARFRRQKYSS